MKNLLAALCLVFCSLLVAAEHTKDDLKTVRATVAKKKAVLLDVREEDEWNDGHLADAKLLPLSRLDDGVKADELKKIIPAGSVVYTHCRSGKRSLKAADLLKKQGYDVRALAPGYEALLKAGFPKAGK